MSCAHNPLISRKNACMLSLLVPTTAYPPEVQGAYERSAAAKHDALGCVHRGELTSQGGWVWKPTCSFEKMRMWDNTNIIKIKSRRLKKLH